MGVPQLEPDEELQELTAEELAELELDGEPDPNFVSCMCWLDRATQDDLEDMVALTASTDADALRERLAAFIDRERSYVMVEDNPEQQTLVAYCLYDRQQHEATIHTTVVRKGLDEADFLLDFVDAVAVEPDLHSVCVHIELGHMLLSKALREDGFKFTGRSPEDRAVYRLALRRDAEERSSAGDRVQ